MAAFVHRGEQGVDVVFVVACREANVSEAEGDLEGMHCRIEAKLVPRRPEALDQLARKRI